MMENIIIGIDLGGTNLRIGAVTRDGEVTVPAVKRSRTVADADDPAGELCRIIADYMEKNRIQKAEAISVGVPSSVKADKETVICTTNIRNQAGEPVFCHTNLAQKIRKHFDIPVFVNNDVKNILLYDMVANHLEGQKIVAGIYIGTGVGASVVIDGKPLEGKDGAELDLGHMPYFGGDISCSCGNKGCCECYASGWKLQKIRERYYPDTRISELFTKHREEAPVKEFIRGCAHVYAVMATIFNPDTIVVGGGAPEMADFPREEFEREVNEHTGRDVMNYGFRYVYSKKDAAKGVIGAALFARRQLNRCASNCS